MRNFRRIRNHASLVLADAAPIAWALDGFVNMHDSPSRLNATVNITSTERAEPLWSETTAGPGVPDKDFRARTDPPDVIHQTHHGIYNQQR